MKHVIYSNYDLWEIYKDFIEELKEQDFTEKEIENALYDNDAIDFTEIKDDLNYIFKGEKWLVVGTVGRWNGIFRAGTVVDSFDSVLHDGLKDCDYIEIIDDNGHLYVSGTHHDGSVGYEIKRVTDKGFYLLEKWAYDYDDQRTEEEIHNIIFKNNLFSALPKVYEELQKM